MTAQFEEKEVIVLDQMCDIESVIARYKKKGWYPTSYTNIARTAANPRSVKIKLRRVKSNPTAP